MQILSGQIGLDPASWIKLEFRDIWAIIIGYQKKDTNAYRSEWVRSRWMAFQLLRPHHAHPEQFKPTDLIRFTWEKSDKVPSSRERFEAVKNKWKLK